MTNSTTDKIERPDFKGRVALVTGASQGIGYEVALGLAMSNARLILLSRKPDEAKEAIAELGKAVEEETGSKPDVSFIQCDLADLKQTRQVAEKLAADEKRIDIAIFNAGLGVEPVEIGNGGFTTHFSINVLSQLLLLNRILPNIRKTAEQNPAVPTSMRIVFQSSSLHFAAATNPSLKFDKLEDMKEVHDPLVSYGISKLALVLAVRKLPQAAGLSADGPKGIRALAAHPAGAVKTDQINGYGRSYGILGKAILAPVIGLLARTVDRGAMPALWAATSPEVDEQELQGRYLTDYNSVGYTLPSDNDENADNLWRTANEAIKSVAGDDALIPWQ